MVEQLQHFFKLLCFTLYCTTFLRNGDNYHIYFIDNLLLFATMKDFQNRLTIDEVITKVRHHVYF